MKNLQRIGNTIYNIIDQYTGIMTTYNRATTLKSGQRISDTDCDGIIYRKLGNEYFKRNISILTPEIFGAKMDGSDDTDAFLKALNASIKYNYPLQIEKEICISSTESIVIDKPITIRGKNSSAKHYRDIVEDYSAVIKDITVFEDNSVIHPPLFYIDGSNTELFGSMPAINLKDIGIVGNGQARKAMYFKQCGWDTNIDDISIDFFKGGAIAWDKQFDANINNLTISRCGGKIGSTICWAIDHDSTVGDNTNALHYNNLHIEFCRYYMRFGKVRHILFNSTKLEVLSSLDQPTRNGVDGDLVNPHVLFENDAREVSFDLGFMVFKETKAWIDNYAILHPELPAITGNDVPFAIQCKNAELRSYQLYKISNFNFTCANFGEGVKLIDTGDFAHVDIESSHLQTLSGDTCAIKMKNSRLIDSWIYAPYTKSNIPVISIEKTTLIGNNFECLMYDENTGYAVEILGDRNVVGPNIYRNFIENYKATATTSKQSSYVRSRAMLQLTDSVYMSIMGISTIDFSNVIIDLAKFDTSFLRLAFSQNAIIKTIKGAFAGEIVKFHCDSTSVFTFKNGGETNADIQTISDFYISANKVKNWLYTGSTFVSEQLNINPNVLNVSSLYNLSLNDFGENGELVLFCNATSGSFLINNTNNLNLNNLKLTVIKTDSSNNTVTLIGTINGLTNFLLLYQNESVTITGNNAGTFNIISQNIVKGGQVTLSSSGVTTISNNRIKTFHLIQVTTKTLSGTIRTALYNVTIPSNGNLVITAINPADGTTASCTNVICWSIIN